MFLYNRDDPTLKELFKSENKNMTVPIPLDDLSAYKIYPKHNWAFDKTFIAKKQGLFYSPVEIKPEIYPIIIRPIINLSGEAKNVRIIYSENDYNKAIYPGCMWQYLLTGNDNKQYGYDAVIDDGEVVWFTAAEFFLDRLKFDNYEHVTPHIMNMNIKKKMPDYIRDFFRENFKGFRGGCSFETRFDKNKKEYIIEIGLRITTTYLSFFSKYGSNYIRNLETFFETGKWPYKMRSNSGWIFMANAGGRFFPRKVPYDKIKEYREKPGITMIHNRCDPWRPPKSQADNMCLAIISSEDYDSGYQTMVDLEKEYLKFARSL